MITTQITTRLKSLPLWAYLQLMRPANILTAWADILMGYAVSGAVVGFIDRIQADLFGWTDLSNLIWLLLSTTGLYAGGVVFNDVFDAELDGEERPERPIPSGRVSQSDAIVFGSTLLGLGVAAAFQVSWLSGGLAVFIAGAALSYDAIGKHHAILGPLNMGICRGANLLLGMSAVTIALQERWFVALIPIVYIAAITVISRGEVHGGNRTTGITAVSLLLLVVIAVFSLSGLSSYSWVRVIPFAGLFIAVVVPPFVKATIVSDADQIRAAVKAGILCLIILDAAIAAGFSHWMYGLFILSLLPISRGLAQIFSVT